MSERKNHNEESESVAGVDYDHSELVVHRRWLWLYCPTCITWARCDKLMRGRRGKQLCKGCGWPMIFEGGPGYRQPAVSSVAPSGLTPDGRRKSRIVRCKWPKCDGLPVMHRGPGATVRAFCMKHGCAPWVLSGNFLRAKTALSKTIKRRPAEPDSAAVSRYQTAVALCERWDRRSFSNRQPVKVLP